MSRPFTVVRKRVIDPSEHTIQAKLWQIVTICKCDDVTAFKIPNEGRRGFRAAAMAKAEGLVAGVPDLEFVLPPNGRAAFLELKKRTGSLSVAQIGFSAQLKRSGALWAVAYSLEEAASILIDWNVLKPIAKEMFL
ncbi:VRR-NUC domain-containing protein [Bradyrhizobium sp. S3.7.6]